MNELGTEEDERQVEEKEDEVPNYKTVSPKK